MIGVVFNIGFKLFVFHVLVVFFAAITRVSYDDFRKPSLSALLQAFQVRFKTARISGPLVNTVSRHKLIFRAYLYIVTGFELTVTHVIFFHPHKGCLGVCLAVAAPVLQDFFLPLIFEHPRQIIFGYGFLSTLQYFICGIFFQSLIDLLCRLADSFAVYLSAVSRLLQILITITFILTLLQHLNLPQMRGHLPA